jgi:hypothetical protein
LAQRAHHPVVAIVAEQHHGVEREQPCAAFLLEDDGPIAAAVGRQVGEGADGELRPMGGGDARVGGVAFEAVQDVGGPWSFIKSPR